MAVAKDAVTTSSAASFTHTPVGTPRGVAVWIVMAVGSDQVTGVTYGGVAMSEHANSPVIAGGSEGGSCYLYFLGSSVPTGPQTVAISLSAGTARSMVQTVTAATDTEIINTGIINDVEGAGGSGARTDTLALGGRLAVVGECIWSETGGVSDLTPLSGWTSEAEIDEGSETNARYTYDTVGTADVTYGFTAGAAADVVVLAAAIGEVEAGGDTYTLDADAASYSYSATAAGLEFDRLLNADSASYAYTASDAALEYDRQVAADSAAYAWTAQDAALEYDRQIVADSAAYAWNATDASLEYTPVGSTYTLSADSAAYLWSATDADLVYTALEHYTLDADPSAFVWSANDALLSWSGEEIATPSQPVTYGGGHEARVRHWWDEIDRLRAKNRKYEEAEQEKQREIEAKEAELSRLASLKRKPALKIERIESEIEAAESEIDEIRDSIDAVQREMFRIQEQINTAMVSRRRRLARALLLSIQ